MLDTVSIERAEADLNRFIERRATDTNRANAEAVAEKLARESRERKYREAVLWQRLDYHRQQLVRHTRTFERILERHKGALRLVEEQLGIAEGEGVAS